jgi:hypothetical protein
MGVGDELLTLWQERNPKSSCSRVNRERNTIIIKQTERLIVLMEAILVSPFIGSGLPVPALPIRYPTGRAAPASQILHGNAALDQGRQGIPRGNFMPLPRTGPLSYTFSNVLPSQQSRKYHGNRANFGGGASASHPISATREPQLCGAALGSCRAG